MTGLGAWASSGSAHESHASNLARRRHWRGASRDYRPRGLRGDGRARCGASQIQAEQAPDLAVRWNCKAGKCGSCSAEINGNPRLMCMTRLSTLNLDEPVTVEPMKAFPLIRDLVTDVSWNFAVKKRIKPFKPRPPDAPDGTWRMGQAGRRARAGVPEVHRVLPVPGRLPRAARPSPARRVHRPALSWSTRRRSRCTRSTPRPLADLKDDVRHRLLQHHQVLHEGVPRAHHDHGQRDHPAQGAGGGRTSTTRCERCCGFFAT